MHHFIPPSEQSLEFLKPYRATDEIFSFPSGEKVPIAKYFLKFKKWQGKPIENTFGNKALIDVNGKPMFAEFAIMHLFRNNGWESRWVETYAKGKMNPLILSEWKDERYKNQIPNPIEDKDILECLYNIAKQNNNSYAGCWDILAWRDKEIIFVESKRQKKDRVQDSQIKWLEASLAHNLKPENFALVEWIIELK